VVGDRVPSYIRNITLFAKKILLEGSEIKNVSRAQLVIPSAPRDLLPTAAHYHQLLLPTAPRHPCSCLTHSGLQCTANRRMLKIENPFRVITMQPLRQTSLKSERLEARISLKQKHLFQHAANLSGRSLTDFAISALQEAAKNIIQEHAIIQLSLRDQQTFVEVLFAPPKPNNRLLKAAKRYQKKV